MKKKIPVVTRAARDIPERLRDLEGEVTISFTELGATIHEGFMAMATSAGLAVMRKMMEAEVSKLVGPKHARIPAVERAGHRHGTTRGPVVLGDRTLSVARPRARSTDGGEIDLETWEVFSDEDLFRGLVVERMLAGVATRRHEDVALSFGESLDDKSKSTSKSTISRAFKLATETALADLMARDLSELEACVLMVDGKIVDGQSCVIALVITTDGTKVPVGLWLGDTENKVVVRDLLADLVARGLDYEGGLLCVIDGGKALAAGIDSVFGTYAVVQRCTMHKRRNVAGYLNGELADTVDAKLALAFRSPDPKKGKQMALAAAKAIEAEHPDAAGSIKEGLDQMFTVRELGIDGTLARKLTTTNAIESMMSIVGRTTGRVTSWKDGQMKKRWIAAGMLEAERSFRRVHGKSQMPQLVEALRKRTSPVVVTATEYTQVAA